MNFYFLLLLSLCGASEYIFTSKDVDQLNKVRYFLADILKDGDYSFEYKRVNDDLLWIFSSERVDIIYNDNSFSFSYIEDTTNTHIRDFSEQIHFYNKLVLTTNASRNVVNSFMNFIDEYYSNMTTIGNDIYFYRASYQYFQRLGQYQSRDIDTIYIPREDKKRLLDSMDSFRDPIVIERYKRLGLPYKRIYMFEGLPGTGKTSLVRSLASMYNLPIYIIPITKDLDDMNLATGIKTIKTPAILLFEDIDALFEARKKTDYNIQITFSGLLNALDGVLNNDGLEIFITTNHIEKLDPALKRPGRVDLLLTFSYATEEQIKDMFLHVVNDNISDADLFYSSIKDKNVTVADLQHILYDFINEHS